jgi:hypothetical protein
LTTVHDVNAIERVFSDKIQVGLSACVAAVGGVALSAYPVSLERAKMDQLRRRPTKLVAIADHKQLRSNRRAIRGTPWL